MIVCRDGTTLSDTQYNHIKHALGLTGRGRGMCGVRWAYRNFFSAGVKDQPHWFDLTERGFAFLSSQPTNILPYYTFRVTRAGVEACGLKRYVPNSLLFE